MSTSTSGTTTRDSLSLELIGTIGRLQVQTVSLKIGARPHSGYDPAGIRSVPALRIDDGGVTGIDDEELADVHHRDHPHTKHRGENGVSIGFTGHYVAMRERFPLVSDGIAGENILVDAPGVFTPEALGSEVVILAGGGKVVLRDVQFAPPCVEFSKFCNGYPLERKADPVIAETVRFLSNGVRGYYATLAPGPAVTVRLGDPVYRRRT